MNKEIKNIRVAVVSDHCFNFAGASAVTRVLGNMFRDVDYYFLMGDQKAAKEYFKTERVYFSFLNRFSFIKRYYRYTYFLWPMGIEGFDFSKYDLVISSSFTVSHGVIVGIDTIHIAYIHTPMRYAWDLEKIYFKKRGFFLKRWCISFFLNLLRIWDVNASLRADVVIANSNFVKDRIFKYWRRDVDAVIHPPVKLYEGTLREKRGEYFVAGAPFEVNKGGEFLIQSAINLGFDLKLIGVGHDFKKLKRRYSRFNNIYFLGRVSQEEKYSILSNARGFLCAGIEDFGIFPVEAISCGTPVISLKRGGYLDSVKEGVNGIFFDSQSLELFRLAYEEFLKKKWNRSKVRESVMKFSEDEFKKKMEALLLKNI